MSERILGWGLLAAAGVILLVFWFDQAPAPEFKAASKSTGQLRTTEKTPHLVGTGSCAGRGCHGRLEPVETSRSKPLVVQDEFTKWVMQDRHAGAWAVLSSSRSRQIARNLGWGNPWEEPRCLACHTNPVAAEIPSGADPAQAHVLLEERGSGVGCEACHGPASEWLVLHRQRGWKDNYSEKQLAAMGWKKMDDLGVRAKTCAGCHIGAPPGKDASPLRDMNHDLIAAGHPRLDFEFASFTENMPRHWQQTAEEKKQGYEAKLWAVGQVASAEAALELLQDRARHVNTRPWPEFAEYDCFACHHGLRDAEWRRTPRRFAQRQPGSLSWGTWYYALLQPLAAQGQTGAPNVVELLAPLRKNMSRPSSSPSQAAQDAGTAAAKLADWRTKLARGKFDTEAARHLLTAIADHEKQFPPDNWDGAEQFFLAAVALKRAQGDRQFLQKHQDLLRKRAFPPSQDSPGGDFNPEMFSSELRKSLE